jgi:hypothetical protein
LIALTDGDLVWDNTIGDFGWREGNAAVACVTSVSLIGTDVPNASRDRCDLCRSPKALATVALPSEC